MYEIFDHTADVGVRVRAASFAELLAEAARALFSLLVANLDEVNPVEVETLEVAGEEPEYLLFDWLSELLYAFSVRRRLCAHFEVTVGPEGLRAVVGGEPIDEGRHRLEHEVKAITYHGLRCEQTADGWTAEFIVDI